MQVTVLLALCVTVLAVENDVADVVTNAGSIGSAAVTVSTISDADAGRLDRLIYNHVNMITHEGTGYEGAHVSEAKNFMLGWNCFPPFYLVESFVVPDDEQWTISELEFFAYQPNSGTNSTISGLVVEIFEGDTFDTSVSIWGDNSANILSDTYFSGIYRISEGGDHSSVTDPIMHVFAVVDVVLDPGTYHIVYQVAGSDSFSGPRCPLDVGANGTFFQIAPTVRHTQDGRTSFKFYEDAVTLVPSFAPTAENVALGNDNDEKQDRVNVAAIVAPVVIGVVLIGAVAAYFLFYKKKNVTVYSQEPKNDVEKQ